MEEPGKYDNPGYHESYPAEKQHHSNPPPPYYPPGPGMQAPVPAPYNQPPYYPSGIVSQQPLICQQSNVVVVNPQSVGVRSRHSDYLCWSIVNFLCCCWPLGLVAIIFSCKTRSDDDSNNEEAASCSSKTALYLNIASLVAGIIMYIIVIVLYTQQ